MMISETVLAILTILDKEYINHIPGILEIVQITCGGCAAVQPMTKLGRHFQPPFALCSPLTKMAGFLRGKQAGIQHDLSAAILPGLFAPDDQARFGINSQIGYVGAPRTPPTPR